jgi:short subunit dehydrogenase-like uncharacterized protein
LTPTKNASDWLLYGAYGFTGRLIAEEAVRRGHRPVLAGRDYRRLQALADRLSLPYRVVSLSDPAALGTALDGVHTVLHAAGPFAVTSRPMVAACLERRAHYLDITGEIPVFQTAYALDAQARMAGIALIPGVGFDIVPSNCLAHSVFEQLPGATVIEIGIASLSSTSRGTTKTALSQIEAGFVVWRAGRMQAIPPGSQARQIRFDDGERWAIPVAWGDLAALPHALAVPNVTAYLATNPRSIAWLPRVAPLLARARRRQALARTLDWLIDRAVQGPDETTRQTHRSHLWARASRPDGQSQSAWLETSEAYRLTAESAVLAVETTLDRQPVGALSPAQAFGSDFALRIPGTKLTAVQPA